MRSHRVIFTDTVGVSDEYAPVPTTKCLPEWYARTASTVTDKRVIGPDGATPHTIKKCVPVFDAMSAGYVLRSCMDIQVTQRDGLPFYQWPQLTPLEFHPVSQAPEHPAMNGAPVPKWINPWAIKTPPGYSCLFVPPMHNPNGIFTILPGVVDTDTYTAPVNLPFVLDDVRWEGLIPAGTPIAQVIPFRRESFQMQLGGDAERAELEKVQRRHRSLFFNAYKRQFWVRKEYR